MPTRMPLQLPTMTDDNIGRLKADLDNSPDLDHYLASDEYNQFRLEFIACCDIVLTLAGAGSLGTLQAAYTAGMSAPQTIALATGKGRILIKDAAGGLGSILLGFSDSAGANEWGIKVGGIQLHPTSTTALHSSSSFRTMSGGSPVTDTAYIFDTAQSYDGTQALHTEWKAFGVRFAGLLSGASPALLFFDTTSNLLQALQATTAGLRVTTLSVGGVSDLLPDSGTPGKLGTAGEPWSGAHAYYFAGRKYTDAFAGSLVINAALGDLHEVTLTGNITAVTLTNFGAGQTLTLKFIQDGAGAWTLSGLPAAVKLSGGLPFVLSTPAGAVDVLVLRSDGTAHYEIGRYQQNPAERDVQTRTLSNANVILAAHLTPHLQVFSGTLSGAVTINLSRAGAAEGDRIRLIFDEVSGVITSGANILTIQENGTGALATYDQAKTLRGAVEAIYTGSAWILPIGGALSYA